MKRRLLVSQLAVPEVCNGEERFGVENKGLFGKRKDNCEFLNFTVFLSFNFEEIFFFGKWTCADKTN